MTCFGLETEEEVTGISMKLPTFFFIQEIAYGNIVCKIGDIVSQLQYVNYLKHVISMPGMLLMCFRP